MTDRIALITGGTRGIGLGIARALAADGWNLLLTGLRPEEQVRPVIEELESVHSRSASAQGRSLPRRTAPAQRRSLPHRSAPARRRVEYRVADVADVSARAALVDFVRTQYGTVTALVNNAGRAPRVRADLIDATEDSFEEVVRTNLQGPYFLTQAIARTMIGRSTGGAIDDPKRKPAIVFVTSVSAEMASPNRGEYCVSKAGLAMAVQLFAVRLAQHGISVFEVRPGIIATDMTAAVREIYDRRIAEGLVPDGRWGRPDDVGRAVAALLRGDIPYATGTILRVDGGLSIPRL